MKRYLRAGLLWAVLALLLCLGALAAGERETAPVPGEDELVFVPLAGADLPDNDALFDLYFNALSFPGPARPFDTGGSLIDWEDQFAVYQQLRACVERVAAGESVSTQFDLTAALQNAEGEYTYYSVGTTDESDVVLGVPLYYCTAADGSRYIGLQNGSTSCTVNGEPVACRKYLVSALLNQGLELPRLIHGYLLADCPASFYWYDKTKGYGYAVPGLSLSYDKTTGRITDAAMTELAIAFTVATDYRAAASNTFAVSPARINRAKGAVATARSYVDAYANASDYRKLDGYRQVICDLVSYDEATLKKHEAGQEVGIDTWQLINVFDGDASTNVVCEGYAKAFQYLCDLSEFTYPVQCYTVGGDMVGATGAGGHMWNVVRMGWQSYMVDITNCDTGTAGYPNRLFMKGGTPDANDADCYRWTPAGSTLSYTYHKPNTPGATAMRPLYGELLTLAAADYAEPGVNQPNWYWYADDVDEFHLTEAGEVAGLVAMLRTGIRDFEGKTVYLDADADLTGMLWPDFSGDTPLPFRGVLDGAGHSVSALDALDGAFLGELDGATVKNLIVAGSLCGVSDGNSTITDCLCLGGVLAGTNRAGSRIQHCCTTGEAVVGTNLGTVANCYYCAESETDDLLGTSYVTEQELASGYAAWLMQSMRGGSALRWGQALGEASWPVPTAEAAKRVYQLNFRAQGTNTLLATRYANPAGLQALPTPPTLEDYAFDKWVVGTEPTAEAFTTKTPVSGDLTLYAVFRAPFGPTNAEESLATTHGQSVSIDLAQFVAYEQGGAVAGRFRYSLDGVTRNGVPYSGNDAAVIEGDTLTVPASAPSGSYVFSVRAVESAGDYVLFAAGPFSLDDVTFTVAAAVAPTAPEKPAAAAVGYNSVTLRAPTAYMNGGALPEGDALEYCYSTDRGSSPWQTGLTFEGLSPNREYRFQCRLQQDGHFGASAPSDFLVLTTAPIPLAEATVTPALPQDGYVYDGEEKTPSVTVTLGGAVIDPGQYTVSYADNVNAGEATVTVTAAAGSDCAGSASAGFAIAKKSGVARSLTAPGVLCDDTAAQSVALAGVLEGLALEGDTPHYEVLGVTAGEACLGGAPGVTAGALGYTLAAGLDGAYTIQLALAITGLTNYDTISLTVTIPVKAYIEVAVDLSGIALEERAYNAEALAYTGAAVGNAGSYTGAFRYTWLDEDDLALGEGEAPVNAGLYTLLVEAAERGYRGSARRQVLISPAVVTVEPGDFCITKVYDGTTAPGQAGGALVLRGVLPGEEVTAAAGDIPAFISPDAGADAQAGVPRAVTLSLRGADAENYILHAPSLVVPFEIAPRPVTVTALAQSIVYGGAIASDVSQVRVDGLVEGHSLARVTLTPSAGAVPGGEIVPSLAKIVTAAQVDMTPNYALTYVPGELTVTPKTLAVSIQNARRLGGPFVYNGLPQRPTLEVRDGESVVPEAEYTLRYENNTLAGVGRIYVDDVPGGNYTISGRVDFAIAKRAVTDKSQALCADGATTLPLLSTGGEAAGARLSAPGALVLAARFEGGAMRQVVRGRVEGARVSFEADLLATEGWRLFFLGSSCNPLYPRVELD